MINNDRIIPIQKMDLLTMFGTILNLASVEYDILESNDVEGNFTVTDGSIYLANQPVKSIDFADGVIDATVYFIAAYDYVGFTIAGVATTPTGTVQPDGVTLYMAELDSRAVTITAVSPVLSAS